MRIYTSDIDWAPEEVILDMLTLYEKYKVKCTLFVTHESEVIKNCNRNLFEIAIHPNFNDILFNGVNENPEDRIKKLMNFYPEAIGLRSHSMTQSTPLLNLFKKCGMKYESNQFLPYWDNIKPFELWNGLMRMPYNWEDDIHFSYGRNFKQDGLAIQNNLNVYDFHPIHVYLNTEKEETYTNAKVDYHNFEMLSTHQNKSIEGARDLLISLLMRHYDLFNKSYTIREYLNL